MAQQRQRPYKASDRKTLSYVVDRTVLVRGWEEEFVKLRLHTFDKTLDILGLYLSGDLWVQFPYRDRSCLARVVLFVVRKNGFIPFQFENVRVKHSLFRENLSIANGETTADGTGQWWKESLDKTRFWGRRGQRWRLPQGEYSRGMRGFNRGRRRRGRGRGKRGGGRGYYKVQPGDHLYAGIAISTLSLDAVERQEERALRGMKRGERRELWRKAIFPMLSDLGVGVEIPMIRAKSPLSDSDTSHDPTLPIPEAKRSRVNQTLKVAPTLEVPLKLTMSLDLVLPFRQS